MKSQDEIIKPMPFSNIRYIINHAFNLEYQLKKKDTISKTQLRELINAYVFSVFTVSYFECSLTLKTVPSPESETFLSGFRSFFFLIKKKLKCNISYF